MGDYFDEPASGGDGKAVRYSAEITRALLEQAAKERPDVLILSGDLTLNGAEKSHRELVEQLHALQNSGVQVLAMAGNHDKVPEISTSSLSVAGSHFGEVVYDGRSLTYTARETDLPQLAETFANINSAYFSGQPIREADFAKGIALWREQDCFVSRYIDTMLESGKKDNLHLVIQ